MDHRTPYQMTHYLHHMEKTKKTILGREKLGHAQPPVFRMLQAAPGLRAAWVGLLQAFFRWVLHILGYFLDWISS